MRRARSTLVVLASLAATLVGVPAAGASQPGDTEHGVNRAKLAAQGERVIEDAQRDRGAEDQQVRPAQAQGHGPTTRPGSACGGPRASTPARCPTTAPARRCGSARAGRWRVDRCENRLQPMAPLLDTPTRMPTFGFNDDWLIQSVAALDLLDAERGRRSPARACRGPGSSRRAAATTGTTPTRSTTACAPAASGRCGCWSTRRASPSPTPAACADGEKNLPPSPQFYDEMAEFAVAAAQALPDSFAFEVWNEPNYPKFWGGPRPSPAAYSEMLKTVADALHPQAPGTTVVSAGLSPHADTDTSGSIGFRDFLIEMYERGAAQKADAIGIHPYPGVGPERGLPRRRARLPGQGPERDGPLRRRRPARCGRPSSAPRPPASSLTTPAAPARRSPACWRCSGASAGSRSRSSTASSRSPRSAGARPGSASSTRT